MRALLGSLLLGLAVRGWFTRVRVLPDRQEVFEEIPAELAVIPNLANRNMYLQLVRGLPPPGRQSQPSEAVEDVLAFYPGLHARLNAVPRYEHDSNTVDDVGTKLETNFANSLTVLFLRRVEQGVALAGARVIAGSHEHQRRLWLPVDGSPACSVTKYANWSHSFWQGRQNASELQAQKTAIGKSNAGPQKCMLKSWTTCLERAALSPQPGAGSLKHALVVTTNKRIVATRNFSNDKYCKQRPAAEQPPPLPNPTGKQVHPDDQQLSDKYVALFVATTGTPHAALKNKFLKKAFRVLCATCPSPKRVKSLIQDVYLETRRTVEADLSSLFEKDARFYADMHNEMANKTLQQPTQAGQPSFTPIASIEACQSFWKLQAAPQFPILAKAAQRLLSAHASTAAAERNWSMWGHTYHNALRNNFSVEAAKREVYLKANVPTTDSDDDTPAVQDTLIDIMN
ncbi:hypothetical protein QJQ45_006603 [Haematococcus lacustris]|nr:hypothetical protein QJQ45_006603 [Haematococcus lacustris]